MKTDKDLLEANANDSTAVVLTKGSRGIILFLSTLPFISVMILIISCLIKGVEPIDMIKVSVLTFLLTTALSFFARMHDSIFRIRFSKSIILFSYSLSIILIMLQRNPQVYSFWMIGALLISGLIDNKIGIIAYFNLAFVLSITAYLNIESTIHLLVMGVLFALLSGALRNKVTAIYAGIILLSSNMTLSFILNNFIFESDSSIDYLASLFSILAVLVTAFLLFLLYDRITAKDNIRNELAISSLDTSEDTEPVPVNDEAEPDRTVKASYDVLLSESNELMTRMNEFSEALYKHCKLIGDLSGRAAGIIGADEELARAGGYYHEVGKIISKNYIEEGMKLAEEYAFPEKLRLILRQHSIKHDKPTFVEAAIVMISDNVASTIEYIKKTGEDKYTNEQIIDNIFKMRMEKGTFDDSGLSIKDFKLLKDFYQNEYSTEKMNN